MKFYRYVDQAELDAILLTGIIESRSGITYFAIDPPSRYNSWRQVRDLLAVSDPKQFRIGPVHAAIAPPWDAVPPRTVSPQQLADGTWVAGGGSEAATTAPHVIISVGRLV